MDRNSTSFNAQLRHFFKTVRFDPATSHLRYVQFVVKTYIEQTLGGHILNGGRGLIINHTMGIGKTITAIELMEMLRLRGHRVLCIGPKAIAENLDANVAKWSKMIGRAVLTNADGSPAYTYLTLRANNLLEQIKRDAYIPTVAGRKIGELPATATLVGALKKTVVVIDEAHLFCNSVAHGRAIAVELYKALMVAPDCYVFLLTGTLVVNSPFEAVPAINLVLGKPYLPETEDEFNEQYGTLELQAINGSRIQNIASGLISYAALDADDVNFPRKLRTKVVMLEMRDEQLSQYLDAREIEANENKANGFNERNKKLFLRSFEGADKMSSSYRVRSRIASNGPNKVNWICELVAAHPNELMLVHMPFVENGGVRSVAKALMERLEYRELKIRDGEVIEGPPDMRLDAIPVDVDPLALDAPPAGHEVDGRIVKYFVVLSGDSSDKRTVAKLLSILNCVNNRYGAYCHVLLTTSVGSTGLDLKNGRIVVYTEPSWHLEEFNQTVARYVRLGASNALPVAEREVQPYILVSVESRRADTSDEPGDRIQRRQSTDEYLLELSVLKMRSNASFLQLLRGVSIECLAGIAADPSTCRTCVANDMPLTLGSHRNDVRVPNPCLDARAADIDPKQMKKMEVSDGVYTYEIHYHKVDNNGLPNSYLMYEYDPASLQYIKLMHGHPLFDAIVKAISGQELHAASTGL